MTSLNLKKASVPTRRAYSDGLVAYGDVNTEGWHGRLHLYYLSGTEHLIC